MWPRKNETGACHRGPSVGRTHAPCFCAKALGGPARCGRLRLRPRCFGRGHVCRRGPSVGSMFVPCLCARAPGGAPGRCGRLRLRLRCFGRRRGRMRLRLAFFRSGGAGLCACACADFACASPLFRPTNGALSQQGTDVVWSEASIHTRNGTTLCSEPIKTAHSDRYTTALSDD